MQIVGVLADAKFDGAREPPRPSIYIYDPKYQAYALIRIRADAVPETLSFIDRDWHIFAPTKAIRRFFLDDRFRASSIRPTSSRAKCSACSF